MFSLKGLVSGACLITLCMTGMAQAQPSSNVAFTAEMRNRIASGDADRGEAIAADCASCHGPSGIAPSPNWPNLAGQLPAYLYKQMRDYKDNKRFHPVMTALGQTFTEEEIVHLAAFYSSQEPPPPQVARAEVPALPLVATAEAADGLGTPALVRRGDGSRLLAPCASCHGVNGEGRQVAVPALAGQPTTYFRFTMRAYKDGDRANDVYGVMRRIAEQLTEQEIDLLAAYYATLDAR